MANHTRIRALLGLANENERHGQCPDGELQNGRPDGDGVARGPVCSERRMRSSQSTQQLCSTGLTRIND